MPQASGSKGATEINGKEHELLFHPHFDHEELTSLHTVVNERIYKKIISFYNRIMIAEGPPEGCIMQNLRERRIVLTYPKKNRQIPPSEHFQRRTQIPVEHLRWSVLQKELKCKTVTYFHKTHHL